MPQNVIGVDIAKHWIDTYNLESGKASRIGMTAKSLKAFAAGCTDALVVFEASGGYERPLAEALAAAGMAYARVNPRQARGVVRADALVVLVAPARALLLSTARTPNKSAQTTR